MSNDHSSHGYQNQQLQLAVMETLIFTSFSSWGTLRTKYISAWILLYPSVFKECLTIIQLALRFIRKTELKDFENVIRWKWMK